MISLPTYQDLKLLLELGISQDITGEVYQLFDQGKLTPGELLDYLTSICDKYKIEKWSLNSEGLVDVDGPVDLEHLGLTRLPLRFGTVTECFWCEYNLLTTLEGAPKWVGSSFMCNNNRLTTLEGAPKWVGGDFWCEHNLLTTLEGAPQEVGGSFDCCHNELVTLNGAPKKVGENFWCHMNHLTTLDGIGEVKGSVSDLRIKVNLV